MIVILCVDKGNGMMFGGRRQSQDRVVREQILKDSGGAKLWMNAYSGKQFAEAPPEQMVIDEEFLKKAQKGEFCFVENESLKAYEPQIEEVILYHWNRRYPSDQKFDLSLTKGGWKCRKREELAGFSHEKITKEVYLR